jgi:hypothetical protein
VNTLMAGFIANAVEMNTTHQHRDARAAL